jgi:RNA polymerase sigma factor (sigma-70 family)
MPPCLPYRGTLECAPRMPDNPDRPGAALAAGAHPLEAKIVALLAHTRAPVKALFQRSNVPPAVAEDILQGALFTIVESWEDLRDPAAYFFGTVRRGIQRHFAKLRRERAALAELALLSPPGAADDPQLHGVECREDARSLLAALPRPTARILEMRYAEDLSSHDVAVALGRSDAAVRQAISRALRHLRRQAQAPTAR